LFNLLELNIEYLFIMTVLQKEWREKGVVTRKFKGSSLNFES